MRWAHRYRISHNFYLQLSIFNRFSLEYRTQTSLTFRSGEFSELENIKYIYAPIVETHLCEIGYAFIGEQECCRISDPEYCVYTSFERYFCENRRFSKHTYTEWFERKCNHHIRVLTDEKWSIAVTPDQIDFIFEVRLKCAIFSFVQCNLIVSSRMQHFLLYFRTFSSHCGRPNVCYYTDRVSFKETIEERVKPAPILSAIINFYALSIKFLDQMQIQNFIYSRYIVWRKICFLFVRMKSEKRPCSKAVCVRILRRHKRINQHETAVLLFLKHNLNSNKLLNGSFFFRIVNLIVEKKIMQTLWNSV